MGWRGLGRQVGGLLAAAALLALGACGGGGAEAPDEPVRAQQALKASAFDAGTAFRGHGTWWNPGEPGTGFFIEAQLATAIVTFYVFDDAGQPTWYAASGPFTQAGAAFQFNGTLQRFQGGQAASSTVPRQPTSTTAGAVAITFDGDTAQVQLPGRSFTARKYFATPSSRGGSARAPETGVYWNPSESGRGYTVESDGETAVVGVFHYEATGGAPTWNLSVVPLTRTAPSFNTAPFLGYTGGQTLDGAFRQAPTQAEDGTFSLTFSTVCTGQLRFPRLPATVNLRRFSFAGLSERDTCRAWSTLADAQPLQYNSATLPSMGTARSGAASADLTVTFAFPLQEPQGITAFTDFSANAVLTKTGVFTTHWRWLSGNLPAGLSFDEATGQLRGVATGAAEAAIEVAAMVDGFGGQVADRQSLVVRLPLVSYLGFSGSVTPIVATSFEVDRFAFPTPVLVLRDPVTLQPMTPSAGVAVSLGVAEGSSLPPGLSFDAASNTVSGTPRVLAARHDTVFEARFTLNGVTTKVQGLVPFRIHATGAEASPGRVDYETLPVQTSMETLQDQLTAQGARGFRYLTNLTFRDGRSAAVYARDAREFLEYQLVSAAQDAITLRNQHIGLGGAGYRWAAAVGPRYEYSAFLRSTPGNRWELSALNWGSTSTGLMVAKANEQGALGALYTGHRTFGGQIVSMHERDTQAAARYEYLASTEDTRTQSDFLARLNAHGARGYRLRPVEVPPLTLAAGALPARLVLLEKDAAQGATFHYATRTVPVTEADFLLMAAEEGRTGGLLAANYLQLSLPGTLVFVRPLQCQGTICRVGPFMPQ